MKNFTDDARKVLEKAETFALYSGNIVESVHLLAAVADVRHGYGAEILSRLGFDSAAAQSYIIKSSSPSSTPPTVGPVSQKILDYAEIVADTAKSAIDTHHILLAIAYHKTCGGSKILARHNIDYDTLLSIVEGMIHNHIGVASKTETAEKNSEFAETVKINAPSRAPLPSEKFSGLGVDLTEKARRGKLGTVIGRDKEIMRVIRILSRKNKNNPVIVGESGVGKTAVVEGLAEKIARGEVPPFLKDRIIFSLNVNSLVAGTRYRGEMEEKIGEVIGAAKEYGVILFIDELHSVVGAGGSEGGLSVAEILKPAVTDGDIAVIGATTYAEYGKYIENDPALCRRFMKVEVAEPSKEEAIRILAGVKPSFEKHYGITVENEAAEACVKLSLRYISGKFLPDKAIDILDEACAKKAISGGKNVDVDDIKDAVNEMTGIPLGNIAESETEKFLNLEKYLNEKIIGQEEAVTSVAKAVRRAEAGLREKNKPSSSFIFLGSTGVGKTETAKALAETLYGGEDAMIRIDMSEYSETNSVSRLIGAPPGYVGYSEGGILTEAVRRKPYCLILFDELEKADPEIFNVLLQVLDDGRLTDGKGRTADFRNATIIFTSNLGTDKLIAKKTVGFGKADESKEDSAILMSALKNFLRPEFLNRIDKIIIFNKLSKESLIKIAKLLLNEKSKNLYEERGIKLNYGDELAEFIVNGSYDPNYGARPIKRQIETQLEDKLSETIIRDDLRNTEMTVKVIGDGLVISENK